MWVDSYHALIVLLHTLLLACCSIAAESQAIPIHVSDLRDRPITGAVLSAKNGGSTSAPSDIAGKTQVQLPQGLQVGDELALVLVRSKPTNLQFYSPWQGRATVPKPPGFIEVVLGVLGDIAALENPEVVASIAGEIDKLNKSSSGEFQELEMNRRIVSMMSGFKAEQIDSAVRRLAGDSKRWKIVEATQHGKSIREYLERYPDSLHKY